MGDAAACAGNCPPGRGEPGRTACCAEPGSKVGPESEQEPEVQSERRFPSALFRREIHMSQKQIKQDALASNATTGRRLRGFALVSVLAALMLTLLLEALDQTIVGTALPRIVGELQGFDRYTWVVTAY